MQDSQRPALSSCPDRYSEEAPDRYSEEAPRRSGSVCLGHQGLPTPPQRQEVPRKAAESSYLMIERSPIISPSHDVLAEPVHARPVRGIRRPLGERGHQPVEVGIGSLGQLHPVAHGNSGRLYLRRSSAIASRAGLTLPASTSANPR